jgi:uncharacterized protein YbjQ (UPF0145 family)
VAGCNQFTPAVCSPRSASSGPKFVPLSRKFGTEVPGDDITATIIPADRSDHFLVSTDSNLGDYRVSKVIGVVSSGHVRSRSLLADMWTAIGGMFGGEATLYSHLANETCTQAIDSTVDQAKVRWSDRHRDAWLQPALCSAGEVPVHASVGSTQKLDADALVGVRLIQAMTMNRFIFGMHKCIICYGTVRDWACG